MLQKEIKPEDVSKLTVKPFKNESWRSHLTFTIKGIDYTWSMPNHSLLTIIENHLSESSDKVGLRKHDRILK